MALSFCGAVLHGVPRWEGCWCPRQVLGRRRHCWPASRCQYSVVMLNFTACVAASAQMLAEACQPATALRRHLPDSRPAALTPAHQAVCLTCVCRWRRPVGTCGAFWRLSAQLQASVLSRPPPRRQSAWLAAWSMAALRVSHAPCPLTREHHCQPESHLLCSSPGGDTGQDSLPKCMLTCGQLCWACVLHEAFLLSAPCPNRSVESS